jgi:TonB family protein
MKKRFLASLTAVFLSLMGPGWAQEKSCNVPDSPLTPDATTRTLPPYPPMAVMTNEDGTTLLEVQIGADGIVISGTVVQSSGSLRLDEAALEHVKATWRWKAPVRNCRPVQSSTRVSITWDLRDRPKSDEPTYPYVVLGKFDYPPGALARREQGEVFISFVITSVGNVYRPQIVKSSGFPELDEKALFLVQRWHQWRPATMDGKGVTTPMVVGFAWRLDPPAAAGKP